MAENNDESGFYSTGKCADEKNSSEMICSAYYVSHANDYASALKEKLEAACRNIEFLKSEHATTIDGLHKEIEKLQNYIRNLQFQQGVLEVLVPNNDFFNCDVATLEQKVDVLITDNQDMKRRLQESNRALEMLDQRQKLEKWQHQQELEAKENTILRLQKELEVKCSTIAELTSQINRKKKSSFLRRFSFTSEPAPSVTALLHAKRDHMDDCLDQHSLKAVSLSPQRSPSHSLHCEYSSYSSLSERSASDEEVLRSPFLRKQYTFPSPKRGYKRNWYCSSQENSLQLPPLPGLPHHERQLIRHQIRIDKLAAKTLDPMAIDQVALPELVDKTAV